MYKGPGTYALTLVSWSYYVVYPILDHIKIKIPLFQKYNKNQINHSASP